MRNVVRVRQFGDKLNVRIQRDRHSDVRQKLIREIEKLDIVHARVGRTNVANVFIEPEPFSAALLAEHQDRTKLVFPARASPRASAVFARNWYFQVAAKGHAEPMMIRINQVEFSSDVDVTRTVRRFARPKHRVARAVKALKIQFT